jgi:hypothetical protein
MMHADIEILRRSLELIQLRQRQDFPALENVLDDDFSAIVSRGRLQDKTSLLQHWYSSPAPGLNVGEITISLFADAALETGVLTVVSGLAGQPPQRFRYNQWWIWCEYQWRLRASQLTALRD